MTTDAPHVNARHILVATQEEAADIIAALKDGESFAELARAASTDTGSGAQGGELGWSSVYGFVKPFSDAVLAAPIGEIVGPIESEFGWHVIQVRARENREITEDALNQAKENRFTSWLEDLRNSEETKVEISSIWTDHVPTDPAFVAS
jgi:peptidyl-prolyl cis-trans isomerase C